MAQLSKAQHSVKLSYPSHSPLPSSPCTHLPPLSLLSFSHKGTVCWLVGFGCCQNRPNPSVLLRSSFWGSDLIYSRDNSSQDCRVASVESTGCAKLLCCQQWHVFRWYLNYCWLSVFKYRYLDALFRIRTVIRIEKEDSPNLLVNTV